MNETTPSPLGNVITIDDERIKNHLEPVVRGVVGGFPDGQSRDAYDIARHRFAKLYRRGLRSKFWPLFIGDY
jgi:hypothetical protein